MPRVDIMFISDTGFGDQKAYQVTLKKPVVGMYIVLPTCAILKIIKVTEFPEGTFGHIYEIRTELTNGMFHRLSHPPTPLSLVRALGPFGVALAQECMDVIQCQCESYCFRFIHLNAYTLKKLNEAKIRIVSPQCTSKQTGRKLISCSDYIAYRT